MTSGVSRSLARAVAQALLGYLHSQNLKVRDSTGRVIEWEKLEHGVIDWFEAEYPAL